MSMKDRSLTNGLAEIAAMIAGSGDDSPPLPPGVSKTMLARLAGELELPCPNDLDAATRAVVDAFNMLTLAIYKTYGDMCTGEFESSNGETGTAADASKPTSRIETIGSVISTLEVLGMASTQMSETVLKLVTLNATRSV